MMRFLWPDSAELLPNQIRIAGCELAALADRYGTPLYVFDEATIVNAIGAYRRGLGGYSAETTIYYASKALLNSAIAQLMTRHGCGLDVVSLNELAIVRYVGVDLSRVHFHGNATPAAELAAAVAWGVGCILVDSLDQLDQLIAITAQRDTPQPIMLRLAPDVAAGGHAHIQTGAATAKFGLPLADGQARLAVERALAAPGLHLRGIHAHIGSQVRDFAAVRQTVAVLVDFAAAMAGEFGWQPAELCPGGGLAVPTGPDDSGVSTEAYCADIIDAVTEGCRTRGLPLPHLSLEPGRSLVGRAGVALYTVTGRKRVPHGVDYVHVDGGMGDNIRPSLYQAPYHAALLSNPLGVGTEPVHVAGRYCESGDIAIRNIALPAVQPGDRLAVPASGAYTLSMASNYNGVGRPAVLLLRDGAAQLIQRRETVEDIVSRDAVLPAVPIGQNA